MQDPLPSPPPAFIRAWRLAAELTNLSTLPLHVHEVLFAWAFYHISYTTFAPIISRTLCPNTYPKLTKKTQINWDVRVVSTLQAFIVSGSALWVIFNDDERAGMDWTGRIWGYTGSMGMVQAFAAGYFLWDLGVSAKYVKIFGPGGLAHAISALIVTCMGFVSWRSVFELSPCVYTFKLERNLMMKPQRPFANYYGLNFVLYALSTPFLNLHWYCDKLSLTGSKLQLYNGIALLTTFFCCRVLWGNYQSIFIYRDLWKALQAGTVDLKNTGDPVFAYRSNPDLFIMNSANLELSRWYAGIYAGSNTILNFLNVIWFSKMVQTVRKRFQPEKEGKKLEEKTK
jgi:hypothetical protein